MLRASVSNSSQAKSHPHASRNRRHLQMPGTCSGASCRPERRVSTHGKVQWMTTAQMIVMQAHSLAEKGNAPCQRLLTRLMLSTSEA
jgi:hypothetical protein